jgi:hypothetical protein
MGLNNHIVSQYVRMGVAINLQRISDIMSSPRVWSFALAIDNSTHRSMSYLNIWIHVCPNGSLENLHLITLPFYDHHTTENIVAMICRILDALYAHWPSKIIAFSIDGENTMIGRHVGVVMTRSLVPGWTHSRVHQMSSCGSWDQRARSRLLTLERGRGSSWEPMD